MLNRISFFSDPADVPILLAPALLQALWSGPDGGGVVFSYPGVPFERCLASLELLAGGCEAVLLRSDEEAPLVAAVAHTARNLRMAAHWADRVEQFFCRFQLAARPESLFGGDMVEHLCDRIGSLRLSRARRFPVTASVEQRLAPAVRGTIEQLLPDSPELQEDPLANSVPVLNTLSRQVQQDAGTPITNLMTFVRSLRADLQKEFDLSTPHGRRGLVDWYVERAGLEFELGPEYIEPIQHGRRPAGAGTDAQESPTVPAASVQGVATGDGVNLIGYPRAEMGMGEQLRSCASALTASGFPFSITEFNHGIIASNQDSRFEQQIRSDHPFEVNLFHINADQMNLAVEVLGPRFFRDHYNIGYWEWELSSFPDMWLGQLDLVDEIWAPSRFIRDAIAAKTSKPVIWMPLAIELPVVPPADPARLRAKFGLPQNAYAFLFPFDFSSFSTRKNYKACIEAFRRAFDKEDRRACLVLKTIRHPQHTRAFWDLLCSIDDDPRIFVIDRVLRQSEMRGLIASCDSLVSLHRSEGFGLGIAEAMYLGKPVVVTNYSGNVDFTREDNSCLVDYQLVPVKPGEYVSPDGQVWAEANIATAARHLRRLVDDREFGAQLGLAAAQFMRKHHSPLGVGKRYASRLQQIISTRHQLGSFPETGELEGNRPAPPGRGLLPLVKRFR